MTADSDRKPARHSAILCSHPSPALPPYLRSRSSMCRRSLDALQDERTRRGTPVLNRNRPAWVRLSRVLAIVALGVSYCAAGGRMAPGASSRAPSLSRRLFPAGGRGIAVELAQEQAQCQYPADVDVA